MYLSLMPTMARDPLSGLCPPDMLGSTTTIPLSIISLIPDIMQHYRDVIIRAEKEIFLVTNYWQCVSPILPSHLFFSLTPRPSASVNTVSGALRDLSAKVVKAGRPKVIVKVMYDRGSWEQLWNAHAPVPPKEWAPLDLPKEEDIPGLSLEVIVSLSMLLPWVLNTNCRTFTASSSAPSMPNSSLSIAKSSSSTRTISKIVPTSR